MKPGRSTAVRLGARALGALVLATCVPVLLAPSAMAVGPDEPGVLVVQTVPPVPGAKVSADGRIVRADDEGIARLPVARFSGLEERFNAPQARVAKNRRVELDRIRGQLHNAYNGKVIEVGLRTERLVSWTFTDRTGQPVHPDRIEKVVFKSSTGELLRLTGEDIGKPRWVAASRTQQTSSGLMSKDIYWTVQSVLMDGSELVNRSQQRFVPDETTKWPISLLFFRARVKAADLLFGTPTGNGIQVTGPDGTVTRHPFDEDGYVTLPAVARGEYRMEVYGAGLSVSRPVSVSKDQDVELLVISRLDLALLGLTLGLIAISLLVVGRRRRLTEWRSARDGRAAPTGTTVGALLVATLLVGLTLVGQPTPAQAVPASDAQPGRGAPVRVPALADRSPVPVLAYYYIWFTPTSWNRAKIDYPLLGRYSSDDEVVMAEHVTLARDAGIDGFLVSWKKTPALNRRLAELAQVASESGGFRLGIVYQGLDFDREPLPVSQVAEDLAWFADEYAGDSTFHTMGDRPVVVWTGTERFTEQEIAEVTGPVADRLQVLASAKSVEDYQRVAPWVEGDAYYWSSVRPEMAGYRDKLTAMSEAVHADGGTWIAPFAPGFDARLVGGASSVPRRDGQTLRDELAAAQASDPDALGLISWNEFSENTHVEPSEEHGTTALHTLALALGATPPPAPADSSDDAVGRAGVTGWGALVLIAMMLGLLNVTVLWRGRLRPASGTHSDTHNERNHP
jgi:hypothetical protein